MVFDVQRQYGFVSFCMKNPTTCILFIILPRFGNFPTRFRNDDLCITNEARIMNEKTNTLSGLRRMDGLASAAKNGYDLIIIGGGITGAGIALDAASRGLSVVLFEMRDFASGTSSRSTKLIHGGLRYLKQLEVGLVREVGRERAILHQNAPHIVKSEEMLLPIVSDGTLGKRSTSLGLYVYDRLAGVLKGERRTMHQKEETLRLEPLLREDIVIGSGLYREYRTDDARLTIEVLKTAASYGAIAFNYAEVTDFVYENGKVAGVKVNDKLNVREHDFYAQKVVNASGPWVDRLRQTDGSLEGKQLHLTKGVHLVIKHDRLPIKQAAYFDIEQDNRMMFVIPRGDKVYLGTTDTDYKGEISATRISKDDVTYLLGAVNHIFPTVELSENDIVSGWAGLRPLIHQEGKDPSELSRKDEIFYSPSGLISIAGGKLTGYRKMAERTVDVVVQQLEAEQSKDIPESSTANIQLSGGNFKKPKNVDKYIAKLLEKVAKKQITKRQLTDLVNKYGKNVSFVLYLYDQQNRTDLTVERRLLCAELHYAIEHEMVCRLNDFLIRRTGRLYFEPESLQKNHLWLLDEMEAVLGWSKAQKIENLEEFEEAVFHITNFT